MTLTTGIHGEQSVAVTNENTAKTMGSGTLDVFATPALVALAEKTCWMSVAEALDEGCGTVGNAVCGDIMRVYLDIDENNVIRDAKFKTFGCGAAIATSSMATVLVKGKTVQEALEVTNKAVMEALDGLPPVKVHLSLIHI